MLKTFKNITQLSIGLIFLLGCLNTYAEAKIGFVNAAKIIEQVPHADAARKALERDFAPRDKKLVIAQKGLIKLEARYKRDAAVMSALELKKLERAILNKKREIKRTQDEFKEDFNIRRNEELAKLQKTVVLAIRKLAQTEKYDVILNDASVVFASDTINVTQKVIQLLKSEFSKKGK